jgi:hypothetical protein
LVCARPRGEVKMISNPVSRGRLKNGNPAGDLSNLQRCGQRHESAVSANNRLCRTADAAYMEAKAPEHPEASETATTGTGCGPSRP